MTFNAEAFTLAGTAIAIFGVALYIWDTRKDKFTGDVNQYPTSGYQATGGSTQRKKRNYKKTIKKR